MCERRSAGPGVRRARQGARALVGGPTFVAGANATPRVVCAHCGQQLPTAGPAEAVVEATHQELTRLLLEIRRTAPSAQDEAAAILARYRVLVRC